MRLISLHTYPVKGCRRIDHTTAIVEPWGLRGDRRWLVIDDSGTAVTQRDVPDLRLLQAAEDVDGLTLSFQDQPALRIPPLDPDPLLTVQVWSSSVLATPAGPEADAWLSKVLANSVRLVWLDDPTRRPTNQTVSLPGDRVSFADGYPLLLTNSASLDQLNEWIGTETLPMTRFRPNVVIDGERPFQEDEWVGRRVQIGGVTFRVPKPCARCIVTIRDQDTGIRGREPLRTLAKHRRVNKQMLFGTNLIPDNTGQLTVGDSVTT